MPATAGFSYGRRDKHADLSKLFPCLTVFTKFFSSNRNSVHGVVLSSDPLEYFAIGRILVIMSILPWSTDSPVLLLHPAPDQHLLPTESKSIFAYIFPKNAFFS